jgi:hypothetical protein
MEAARAVSACAQDTLDAMVARLLAPTLAARCSGDGGSSVIGVRGTRWAASRQRGRTVAVARR